jgi:hypothetical protein
MAMIQPPDMKAPERILLYGVAGTGKSTAVLSIAKATGANVTVVDTERAHDRLLETEWQGLNNVTVKDVRFDAMVNDTTNWDEMIGTVRDTVKTMKPGDWLVIDSITPTWDDVQAWFTQKLWGDDLADYMMAARMQAQDSGKKGGSAFEGFTDWPVINKTYNTLYNLILNAPGHVLLTAETAALIDEGSEVQVLFGAHGVKPKGQKRLPHIPHTVLLTGRKRTGEWTLSTVKDRGRDTVSGKVVTDFAKDYLGGVCGWKQEAAFRVRPNDGSDA